MVFIDASSVGMSYKWVPTWMVSLHYITFCFLHYCKFFMVRAHLLPWGFVSDCYDLTRYGFRIEKILIEQDFLLASLGMTTVT